MAWQRMMGPASVGYYATKILGTVDGDDHLEALARYARRGETPLRWGGDGARAMGLAGTVDAGSYAAIYRPGGACDPTTGKRLVDARRPGLELIIAAHKSVALLGVIGRGDHMHHIMDAERDATMAYLDEVTTKRGARRGRAATPVPTHGMIYATARYPASRAGDPSPYDVVLVANVAALADHVGGYKAADTRVWRDYLHAATVVGRMAAARTAVELGYAIERDDGPSGRLGHWAIGGVPRAALELFSKRAAQIDDYMATTTHTSYRSRGIAAQAGRGGRRDELLHSRMSGWRDELEAAGMSVGDLAAGADRAGRTWERPANRLGQDETERLVDKMLAGTGRLARRKVFCRRDVTVVVAPWLYGREVGDLGRVVDATLAATTVVRLVRTSGALEAAFSTSSVVAADPALAARVDVAGPGGPGSA